MGINQKHLDLFNELFSEDSTKRESFTDEEKKLIAALIFNLAKREHYQDFQANAEQIAVELDILRKNVDKNIAALKVYHLARHRDGKHLANHLPDQQPYDNIDQIIEKVVNKTCASREEYLISVAFIYELNRLSFVFEELEPFGIFTHHPELNAFYEDTKKCHQAIKAIGLEILFEQVANSSRPGLFSNGRKETSIMNQLEELLGFKNHKFHKP